MKKTPLCLLFILGISSCNKDNEILVDTESPDISPSLEYSVLEYTPAPGQFINDATLGFGNITTGEMACRQVEKRFLENLYVSLGSWGGYIIVKFNKSIKNSSGEYDFAIGCNSFDSSNEPGIVWVMSDENANGLPDDTWYELKGSYFGEEGYERNYWVRYSRPEPMSPTPWIDSNGETGQINWMGHYHSQDFYYPDWIKEDSYTLYGSRLPSRAQEDDSTGMWQNPPFDWGYADNFGEDFLEASHVNRFKISDAIDQNNRPVDLKSIDFIKVQTAINAQAGWLGENSTEVSGFFSLNK